MSYLAAAAALYQGVKNSQAAKFDATSLQNEQTLAVDQGNAAEGIKVRSNRQALDAQSAAIGAAGTGYGGSSGISLQNSAVNQELDALNTKYRGIVSGFGYGIEAQLKRSQARSDLAGGALLAGSDYLQKSGYLDSRPTPSG